MDCMGSLVKVPIKSKPRAERVAAESRSSREVQLDPNFESVAAKDEADAVDDVINLLRLYRRLILRTAERIKATHLKLRQPSVVGTERNARNA